MKNLFAVLLLMGSVSFQSLNASLPTTKKKKLIFAKKKPAVVSAAAPAPANPVHVRCAASKVVFSQKTHNGSNFLITVGRNVYCQNFNCNGNHFYSN